MLLKTHQIKLVILLGLMHFALVSKFIDNNVILNIPPPSSKHTLVGSSAMVLVYFQNRDTIFDAKNGLMQACNCVSVVKILLFFSFNSTSNFFVCLFIGIYVLLTIRWFDFQHVHQQSPLEFFSLNFVRFHPTEYISNL